MATSMSAVAPDAVLPQKKKLLSTVQPMKDEA